jgi:hypothetical protein
MSWFTLPSEIVILSPVVPRCGPCSSAEAANNAAPIARNCTSGSRTARLSTLPTRDGRPPSHEPFVGTNQIGDVLGAFLDRLR